MAKINEWDKKLITHERGNVFKRSAKLKFILMKTSKKNKKYKKDKIIKNTCVKQRKSHPKTKNKPSVDVGPFDKNLILHYSYLVVLRKRNYNLLNNTKGDCFNLFVKEKKILSNLKMCFL